MRSKWKTIGEHWGVHHIRNMKTGEVKKVIVDRKYKEAIANGDFLQPDNPKFFKRYPHMKVRNGVLIDTDLEYFKREEKEREVYEAIENRNYLERANK